MNRENEFGSLTTVARADEEEEKHGQEQQD